MVYITFIAAVQVAPPCSSVALITETVAKARLPGNAWEEVRCKSVER